MSTMMCLSSPEGGGENDNGGPPSTVPSPSSIERIYIGGIDPTMLPGGEGLTVEEVAQRLQQPTTLPVRVEAIEWPRVPPGQWATYCHLSARYHPDPTTITTRTHHSEHDPPTALQVLRKLYHNVLWKGCRLKVEAAQPRYLDRLAQERRERQQLSSSSSSLEPPSPLLSPTLTHAAPSSSTPPVPRYWRIRRRGGEMVWTVDTHPLRVTDGSTWVRKLQRRRQKRSTPPPPKQPPIHTDSSYASGSRPRARERALHWVWELTPHDDDGEENAAHGEAAPNHDHALGKVEEADQEDEDDDDDDDDDDDGDDDMEETDYNPMDVMVSREAAKVDPFPKPASYVWSDDDSQDGQEEDDHGHRWQTSESRATMESRLARISLDEFARGGDMAPADHEYKVEPSWQPDHRAETERSLDLQADVASNLHVLAKLFPELTSLRPAAVPKPGGDDDGDAVSMDAATKGPVPPSGWASSGQMIRFDPSKSSAEQFLLKALNANTKLSSVDNTSETPVKDDHTTQEPRVDHSNDLTGNIYEQKMLEVVFREARNGPRLSVSPAEKAAIHDAAEGNFSFAFNLPPSSQAANVAQEPAATTFSFSFGLPPTSQPEADRSDSPAGVQPPLNDDAMESDETFRRHGYFFPKEDIDQYVRLFYTCKDGHRILDDLEGFRNDKQVAESWNKERKALTLDWKRKHKYALARKQKQYHHHR